MAATLQATSKTPNPLHLRRCIQKVATGPEFSKDLSFDEAYQAMQLILSDDCDPVQAAVYLVGLRMKRETLDECGASLKAITDSIQPVAAQVDHLVDIGDMYNGYARSIPMTPFLPAVLASCDAPVIIHGVKNVGPKFGLTTHRVLNKLGVATNCTATQACKLIEDRNVGWAYIDQSVFCPELYRLVPLRTKIVKRPVLTTVEVLTNPIRGRKQTHLITGYVHKAYPPVYAHLAHLAGFDTAAIVRGVEGGIIPSLKQAANVFEYHQDQELKRRELDAKTLGIECTTRSIPVPQDIAAREGGDDIEASLDTEEMADYCIAQGLAALEGNKNTAYNALVYAGAIALTHLKRHSSLEEAASEVRDRIDCGASLQRLDVAISNKA